jgi:hypothetical protein
VKIEGPKFRLWLAPNLTAEERGEAAHAICRFLVDPPRPQAERRRVAVRTALAQYQGSPSRRAKELGRRYRAYLASGWRHERDLETLPEPRSTERVLLHRLGRLNGGRSLCWRQLFDIATGVSPASRTSADGPGAGEKTLAARL